MSETLKVKKFKIVRNSCYRNNFEHIQAKLVKFFCKVLDIFGDAF